MHVGLLGRRLAVLGILLAEVGRWLRTRPCILGEAAVDHEAIVRPQVSARGGLWKEAGWWLLSLITLPLVMHLPKEKLIFVVDFVPIQAVHWRNMPDSWLDEWETSLKRVLAMNWDRLLPGHPGPGGRLGNKQDVENVLQF